MDNKRIPPNDVEAEQSVLASILCDAECIPSVVEILKPEDFYRPNHVAIYQGMISLYEQRIPVDVIMLKNELEKKGIFQQVGGGAYLAEVAGGYYTSVNVKHHALEIKRRSESRGILKLLTGLLQKPEPASIDDFRKALQAAESNQYIKSHNEKSMQNIDDFKRNIRQKKQRILTGFGILDCITGGFRIPSVAMIGAYPSVGKTAFALNIAVNQDEPVIFFSLEMSSEMIYERLASAKLKINYNSFTTQQLTEDEYRDIEEYTDTLKQKQIHVFDDMYYIEQQVSAISNIKPALVVVDYIQKVKTHKRTDARRHEMDYISGLYKQIAKDNHCVILLLSQLSRGMTSQSRPTMSNLKESGALEADGDYVGILHRPYVMQKDNPGEIRPEDGYILIDKNKFGNTGQINLYFDGKHQQFREVEVNHTSKHGADIKPKQNLEYTEIHLPDSELPFF